MPKGRITENELAWPLDTKIIGYDVTSSVNTENPSTSNLVDEVGIADIIKNHVHYDVSQEIYVNNQTGSNNGDGSISAPYATLTYARESIEQQIRGNIVIYLSAGYYEEDITIEGLFGSGSLIIDTYVSGASGKTHVHKINISDCALSIKIYGISTGYEDSAVYISNCSDVHMEDCIIENGTNEYVERVESDPSAINISASNVSLKNTQMYGGIAAIAAIKGSTVNVDPTCKGYGCLFPLIADASTICLGQRINGYDGAEDTQFSVITAPYGYDQYYLKPGKYRLINGGKIIPSYPETSQYTNLGQQNNIQMGDGVKIDMISGYAEDVILEGRVILQILTNGNFADETNGWSALYANISAVDNICTISPTGQSSSVYFGRKRNDYYARGSTQYSRVRIKFLGALPTIVKFAIRKSSISGTIVSYAQKSFPSSYLPNELDMWMTLGTDVSSYIVLPTYNLYEPIYWSLYFEYSSSAVASTSSVQIDGNNGGVQSYSLDIGEKFNASTMVLSSGAIDDKPMHDYFEGLQIASDIEIHSLSYNRYDWQKSNHHPLNEDSNSNLLDPDDYTYSASYWHDTAGRDFFGMNWTGMYSLGVKIGFIYANTGSKSFSLIVHDIAGGTTEYTPPMGQGLDDQPHSFEMTHPDDNIDYIEFQQNIAAIGYYQDQTTDVFRDKTSSGYKPKLLSMGNDKYIFIDNPEAGGRHIWMEILYIDSFNNYPISRENYATLVNSGITRDLDVIAINQSLFLTAYTTTDYHIVLQTYSYNNLTDQYSLLQTTEHKETSHTENGGSMSIILTEEDSPDNPNKREFVLLYNRNINGEDRLCVEILEQDKATYEIITKTVNGIPCENYNRNCETTGIDNNCIIKVKDSYYLVIHDGYAYTYSNDSIYSNMDDGPLHCITAKACGRLPYQQCRTESIIHLDTNGTKDYFFYHYGLIIEVEDGKYPYFQRTAVIDWEREIDDTTICIQIDSNNIATVSTGIPDDSDAKVWFWYYDHDTNYQYTTSTSEYERLYNDAYGNAALLLPPTVDTRPHLLVTSGTDIDTQYHKIRLAEVDWSDEYLTIDRSSVYIVPNTSLEEGKHIPRNQQDYTYQYASVILPSPGIGLKYDINYLIQKGSKMYIRHVLSEHIDYIAGQNVAELYPDASSTYYLIEDTAPWTVYVKSITSTTPVNGSMWYRLQEPWDELIDNVNRHIPTFQRGSLFTEVEYYIGYLIPDLTRCIYPTNESAAFNSIISAIGSGMSDVTSVNGQNGIVVLDTDDISEGAVNAYWKEAPADGTEYVRKDSTWVESTAGDMSDPMTTRGDIIIRDTANVTARLPIGASQTVLTSDGTDPSWQPICYMHTQSVPLSTWTVEHNLNKFVSVTVFDNSNNEVEAEVDYVDNNTVTVTFSGTEVGKVYVT